MKTININNKPSSLYHAIETFFKDMSIAHLKSDLPKQRFKLIGFTSDITEDEPEEELCSIDLLIETYLDNSFKNINKLIDYYYDKISYNLKRENRKLHQIAYDTNVISLDQYMSDFNQMISDMSSKIDDLDDKDFNFVQTTVMNVLSNNYWTYGTTCSIEIVSPHKLIIELYDNIFPPHVINVHTST